MVLAFGDVRMRIAIVVLPLLIAFAPAFAADETPLEPVFSFEKPAPVPFISEFRLGAFAHAFDGMPEKGSVDINGEILFTKPVVSDPLINSLIPRPHIGGNFNLSGDTSTAYAGLTWTFDLTQKFFLEGSFGASINNGDATNPVAPGRNGVGCNFLFRESASIGYNITNNFSVMGTIEHHSNANLCERNAGITSAGVRFGYKF
jgi:lipid A 3-O-deacylase